MRSLIVLAAVLGLVLVGSVAMAGGPDFYTPIGTRYSDLLVGNSVVNVASWYAAQSGFSANASNGQIQASSAGAAAQFNRHATDGSLIVFRKAATVFGSLGVSGTSLTIAGTGGIELSGGGATDVAVTVWHDGHTTGSLARFIANNGSPSHTGNLVEIINDFNSGSATDLLYLEQADNGGGIVINMERGGAGLTVDGAGWGYSAILMNGNVGIGTASPAAALDVIGDVWAYDTVGSLGTVSLLDLADQQDAILDWLEDLQAGVSYMKHGHLKTRHFIRDGDLLGSPRL